MTAARAGDAERARACLLHVVAADERNVQAWYWLSRVVAWPEEREICLENVLALDPGHTAVHAELADLRRQRSEAEKAALLSREAIAAAIPLTAEEQLISDAAVEPLHCPYCDALAAANDRQCPACDRDLYVRERKSKNHSFYSLGLVAAWFGLANYIWLALFVTYLAAGSSQAIQSAPGLQRTFETLGNWLDVGQASGLSHQGVPLALMLVAGGAAFLFSLLVAVGLYRRLRFFYWLTIGLILLGLLATLYQAIQAETLPVLLVAIEGVLFLLAISFAFMAYDEFAWVERRLDAAVDKDVDSPSTLYARGRDYAEQGMWAKAAAHWSRAVALSPGHPEYRLALATAYVDLGQPERALEHVQKAQEIEPHNPQVRELLAALAGKGTGTK
jgi:tetratricopeptide (TPR) repeat protein